MGKMGKIEETIKNISESDSKSVKKKYFEITEYFGKVSRHSSYHRVAAQEAMWNHFMKKYLDRRIIMSEDL